ncbi:MAG: methyltransferase domain-containing protein [Ignavibacteria bacterium]|nr:methyltransferase domain-containing protein [Ignavibacteria bacterium]
MMSNHATILTTDEGSLSTNIKTTTEGEAIVTDDLDLAIVPRFHPQNSDPLLSLEHYHRYLYASRFVKNKRVLDIACGEGYGTAFLSLNAAEAIGIDPDETLISEAREKYASFPRARYEARPVMDSGFGEQNMDAIIVDGLFNHLNTEQRHGLLKNLKHTLTPEGIAVISFTLEHPPVEAEVAHGPSRRQEMTAVEFAEFLKKYFQSSIFIGQKLLTTSTIWSLYQWKDDYFRFYTRDDLFTLTPEDEQFTEPSCLIAICSDNLLSREIADGSNSCYYDTRQISKTREMLSNKQQLESQLRDTHTDLASLRADNIERLGLVHQLRGEIATYRQRLEETEATVEQRNSLVAVLENDLANAHASIETLQQAYDLRTARANGLKEEQNALAEKVSELKAKIEEREIHLNEAAAEYERLRVTIQKLEDQLAERSALITQGDEEKGELRQRLEEVRKQVVDDDHLLKVREGEIAALTAQVESLRNIIDEKSCAVSTVDEELTNRAAMIRHLEETIEEEKRLASSAGGEIAELRNKNQELQRFYNTHAEELSRTQEERSRLSEQITHLQHLMSERSTELARVHQEFEKLQVTVGEFRKTALEKTDLVSTLTKDLEAQCARLEVVQGESVDRAEKIIRLETRVNEQTAFLGNLQRNYEEQALAARQAKAELEKQVIAFDTYQKSQSDLQLRYSKSQIKVQELQAWGTMVEQKLSRILSSPMYRTLTSLGLVPKEKI